MRPATLARLALAGTRTDVLRVALTGLSAALGTLAVLAAATVLTIRGMDYRYSSHLLVEPGLRPGVAFALVLLTIPVLALAAQCGRLGAPARDRRLAAIRLAGATPRQAVAVAVAETGTAVALGTVAGFVAYFAGRAILHVDAEPRPLPTDVLPPAWLLAAVAVGLPLAAIAIAAVLLRRVVYTPFGLARRTRRRAPRPWPALLIVLALGGIPVYETTTSAWPVVLGSLVGIAGVVLGTGWLSSASGRVLHRYGRGPATLLAARRLMADPWSGSRTFAALLACVTFGAGAVTVRAWLKVQFAAEPPGGDDHSFYFDALDLVDAAILTGMVIAAVGLLVALAEGIVARRRTYAALAAAGVPRTTLARSILWQVLAPLVPAIGLALVVGSSLIRGVGTTAQDGSAIPAPLGDLVWVGAVALGAVLVVVAVSIAFLRPSTAVEELRVA